MGPRRALLLFRLALYGTALALGIWVLTGRGDAAAEVEYHGETSQRRPITVTVDGEFFRVDARVEATCAGSRPGMRWYTVWEPGDLRDGHASLTGSAGRHLGGGWSSARSYDLHGKLEGGRFEGSISVTETWDGGTQGRTRCSGDVTFTAQR